MPPDGGLGTALLMLVVMGIISIIEYIKGDDD